MTATPTRQHASDSHDVIIVGAGPVGLTIANTLGIAGVSMLVIETLDQVIDYPRAIGIDDEALRTLQAAPGVGMVGRVHAGIDLRPQHQRCAPPAHRASCRRRWR